MHDGLPPGVLTVFVGKDGAGMFQLRDTRRANHSSAGVARVMNTSMYFHGIMVEVLGDVVGHACHIYIDGVRVLG